jgi:hypothetical protein
MRCYASSVDERRRSRCASGRDRVVGRIGAFRGNREEGNAAVVGDKSSRSRFDLSAAGNADALANVQCAEGASLALDLKTRSSPQGPDAVPAWPVLALDRPVARLAAAEDEEEASQPSAPGSPRHSSSSSRPSVSEAPIGPNAATPLSPSISLDATTESSESPTQALVSVSPPESPLVLLRCESVPELRERGGRVIDVWRGTTMARPIARSRPARAPNGAMPRLRLHTVTTCGRPLRGSRTEF